MRKGSRNLVGWLFFDVICSRSDHYQGIPDGPCKYIFALQQATLVDSEGNSIALKMLRYLP